MSCMQVIIHFHASSLIDVLQLNVSSLLLSLVHPFPPPVYECQTRSLCMSFGFSVGDFLAAIELANRIRKEFVNAPSQFKAIADEYVLTIDFNTC